MATSTEALIKALSANAVPSEWVAFPNAAGEQVRWTDGLMA